MNSTRSSFGSGSTRDNSSISITNERRTITNASGLVKDPHYDLECFYPKPISNSTLKNFMLKVSGVLAVIFTALATAAKFISFVASIPHAFPVFLSIAIIAAVVFLLTLLISKYCNNDVAEASGRDSFA